MTAATAFDTGSTERSAPKYRLPQYLALYVGAYAGFLQMLDIAIQRFAVADRYFTIAVIASVLGLPLIIGSALLREMMARESAVRPRPPARRPGRWVASLVFVALAVAGVRAAAEWRVALQPREKTLPRVLIAGFESRTTGDTLAAILVEALRVDLENDATLSVVDPRAVSQAIALDGIDPDSSITRSLALQYAPRLQLSGIMEGEVEQAGDSYLIIARLLDRNGDRIASARETAATAGALWGAVDRVSGQLRAAARSLPGAGAAGTALPRTSPGALEQYAAGVRAQRAHDPETAERHYQQVLAADSTFLPALRALGELLHERGDTAVARTLLTRAREHAASVLGRERYLALAAYYARVEQNPARASVSYRRILEAEPADSVARARLAALRPG